MNGFREGILQVADNVIGGVASMGVAFGWFPDGRDLVDLLPGKGFQTLSFPDHEDEGWPAFELRVPDSLEFRGAYFSILARRAHLTSASRARDLAAEFESLAGVTFELQMGRGWTADLPGGIELALVDDRDGGAIFGARQTRSVDALEAAMKARGGCEAGDAGAGEADPPDDSAEGGDETDPAT